jgi:hypothetical protein
MHRQEWTELTTCIDCGDEIDPATDDAFPVGETGYLCLKCAVRRGGSFDPEEDRWTTPPDVADLPDERRPHP